MRYEFGTVQGQVNNVYDHIYQYMHGRMGVQSISVLIMILVRKGGATFGLGGFGNIKTSDGLIDGLSLLLGFGYDF